MTQSAFDAVPLAGIDGLPVQVGGELLLCESCAEDAVETFAGGWSVPSGEGCPDFGTTAFNDLVSMQPDSIAIGVGVTNGFGFVGAEGSGDLFCNSSHGAVILG